jgi:hypothetical protein
LDFDHVAVGPLHSVEPLLELCGWNVGEVAVMAVLRRAHGARDPQIAYPNKSRLTTYFGTNSDAVWAAYQHLPEADGQQE